MIYPKEMQKTIEELRRAGDLNEKALKYYYIELIGYYSAIVWIFSLVILAYAVGTSVQFPIWLLILCIVVSVWICPSVWRVHYAPYIHGEVQVGEVTSIRYRLSSVHISIKNKITENKDDIDLPFLAKARHLRKGVEIEYYKSPDNYSALKQLDIMKKYCLKKSLIQES